MIHDATPDARFNKVRNCPASHHPTRQKLHVTTQVHCHPPDVAAIQATSGGPAN
jgi:hypothetical protein